MFDNPQKDLQRLQEQLLAAEEEPEAAEPAQEPELPEEPEYHEQPETEKGTDNDTITGSRRLGWILAVLLLELGAALALLAWWMQWR